MLVAVQHGRVSGLLNTLAEGQGVGAELGGGEVVGTRHVAVGDGLLVEHDGVAELDVGGGEAVDDVVGLFARLVLGDGLGEEVHAHLDARRRGAGKVGEEVLVEVHGALAVPAEAQAQHGEVDTGGLDLGPVDLAVVLGHVDARLRERDAVFHVREQAVFLLHDTSPVVGAHPGLFLGVRAAGLTHAVDARGNGDRRHGHGNRRAQKRRDELGACEGDGGTVLLRGTIGTNAAARALRARGRRHGAHGTRARRIGLRRGLVGAGSMAAAG